MPNSTPFGSDLDRARFWAKVNKTETCWLWTGAKTQRGYGDLRRGNKMTYRAHRYSYALHHGGFPDDVLVDHICRNVACVRPDHLRPTDTKQNAENRSGANKGNVSGVRGVTFRKDIGKWRGRVRHNDKLFSAGTFDTVGEAEAAVIELRRKLFTHSEMDKAA